MMKDGRDPKEKQKQDKAGSVAALSLAIDSVAGMISNYSNAKVDLTYSEEELIRLNPEYAGAFLDLQDQIDESKRALIKHLRSVEDDLLRARDEIERRESGNDGLKSSAKQSASG